MRYHSQLPLLQWIAVSTGNICISDIKYLDPVEKDRLALIIETEVMPSDASLAEWNEALVYIFKDNPRISKKLAREALIQKLREL